MATVEYISKGELLRILNELGNHAPESCLPGISLVTKEVFNMGESDIAKKMASELKTARMDGRREGVADGYKAGYADAIADIIKNMESHFKIEDNPK